MQVTCVRYILHHLLLLSDILTLGDSSEDEEERWTSVGGMFVPLVRLNI